MDVKPKITTVFLHIPHFIFEGFLSFGSFVSPQRQSGLRTQISVLSLLTPVHAHKTPARSALTWPEFIFGHHSPLHLHYKSFPPNAAHAHSGLLAHMPLLEPKSVVTSSPLPSSVFRLSTSNYISNMCTYLRSEFKELGPKSGAQIRLPSKWYSYSQRGFMPSPISSFFFDQIFTCEDPKNPSRA